MSAGLLPAKLLSLSDFIAPLAPTTYPLNPSVESYEAYGISVEMIPTLKQWWDENHLKEIGWQNVFYTFEFARRFVRQFVRKREDVVILGPAIHRKYVSLLLEGYEYGAGCGVEQVVERGANPSTGEVLGFDILSYDYCRYESWVRYGYPEVIHKELNIKPNASGFINTFEEAHRCDQFMVGGYRGS
jgi:hypothetical protein